MAFAILVIRVHHHILKLIMLPLMMVVLHRMRQFAIAQGWQRLLLAAFSQETTIRVRSSPRLLLLDCSTQLLLGLSL